MLKIDKLKIDKRLLDMTDPAAIENFNRILTICGAAISSIDLTADETGKITGGTVTLSDESTIPITVA